MVEPVGATLATVSLLQPLFHTCRELYRGYRLTRAFGEDFDRAQRRLEIQYILHENIGQTKLRFLNNSSELWGEANKNTKAILNQLGLIQEIFKACDAVLKKYNELEQAATENSSEDTTAGAQDPTPGIGRSDPLPQIVLPPEKETSRSATKPRSLSKGFKGLFSSTKKNDISGSSVSPGAPSSVATTCSTASGS
ncbi:hypothetical protein BDW02DRAFT_652106, partial [Decorospora gaudefroyi]